MGGDQAAENKFGDTALVVLSRFSGEGWDRSSVEYNGEFNPWPDETSMPKLSAEVYLDGDFYLTAGEKKLLEIGRAHV